MPPTDQRGVRRWRGAIIGVVVCAGAGGAALLAAHARPFTWGANILTAVPVVLGLLVLVRRLQTEPRRASVGPLAGDVTLRPVLNRWALSWAGLFAAAVGWELYCYLSAPREAHPTLSVLINLATATPGGRSVAFLAWLALGYYLVAAQ